ncbi:MAG: NADH-quinone oxidoreductase subunit NuoG [Deltaproteobacteria bacterium]|nr:NADH-quinone oxidoreductase subunit NuoG [Deltaproteobacteria bacterium]
MPKLVIDDREIEVPEGTKVIEAAEKLGIMIPRFCYHPGLGSVGACRVCAVKFLEGPFKGVQMSCMIDAKDGMIVSTTDEEAMDFRQYVIEWLMLHHPHDCPVCDEGGHCLLQDMTVSGGHGIRRYLGMKRTYRDQNLGPLIQHEMNRCIHCYRCSRFYQEFTGYRDLGVMQIGNRTFFGRYQEGTLESPFTGNLSDICPTGVYTDKPSRFFGRRWDYQRSPTLCIHCSLGCHTVASGRYREVVRQEARYSEAVNGYFICDRGRYGFFYASSEDRPRQALVDGKEVSYDQAIREAREKLGELIKRTGPDAVACVSSERSSLETQAMLKRICQTKGWHGPSYFVDGAMAQKVKSASSRLESGLAVSLREVESADCILVIGADPINEAPMLALAMRQAQRSGGKIAVIDPRSVSLPFAFHHLHVEPDEVNLCASLLVKAAVDVEAATDLEQSGIEFYQAIPKLETVSPSLQEQISKAAQELKESKRPIIVCGTETVRQTTPALAADHTLLLQAADKQAGLFYLLPGANSFSAALLAGEAGSLSETVKDIENGTIKGLILVESNPLLHFHDRQRMELALEKLELLVVLDHVNSSTKQRAHIFLPTSTVYETGGVFINQEGRLQAAPREHLDGTPIAQVSGGNHPPRVYGSEIPGGEPRPGWQALAEFAHGEPQPDEDTTRSSVLKSLSELNPAFADIPAIDELPDDGIRMSVPEETSPRFSLEWLNEREKEQRSDDSLELVLVNWTFSTEELSQYSPPLMKLEKEPAVFIHVDDAARLGLSDSDRVTIVLDRGSLEVSVSVKENMASGIIVMPRHRLLEWQKIETLPKFVSYDDVRKVDT